MELRLFARERGLVLPGERLGFLSLLPRALERGLGGLELGMQIGGRRRVHELLAHRAGLAGNQPLAEVIGLVQTVRAMQRLLRRLEAALRLLRGPPGRLGLLLQPLDLPGLLFHLLALPGELAAALRRAPASGAQLDGAVADALQQLVQLRVIAGGLRGLPGRIDGCLLLRLHGLRRFDRRGERGQLTFQSPQAPRLPLEGRMELLAFREASDHLVEASHLLAHRRDRLGGFLRGLQRAGLLLPILLRGVMAGLGFVRRLRRRLRGGGGPGRFVEKRQQGHRASRRLDPRFHKAHLLGLLPQSGPLFFDLPKLPGFRVLAAQPGERGLGVVPPLSRGFERLDDPGVLRLQPGDSGLVDAGVLVRQELLQRIDSALLRRRQTLSPLPHPLVDVEPEQRAEHAAPVSRLRFEKPGELALRQNHGLHERGRRRAPGSEPPGRSRRGPGPPDS